MKSCTALVAALLVVGGLSTVQAQQTLYWDIDSSIPGAGGSAPSGAWNVGSGNWSTDPLGAIDTTGIAWAANDNAIFSAGTEGLDDATGAYVITAGAGVEPASMIIDDGRVVLAGTPLNMSATDTVRINQGAVFQIPGQAQVVTAAGHVITFDGGEIRNSQTGVTSNVYGQGAGPPIGRLTANGGTINVSNGAAYGIYNWIGSFDLDTGVTAATLTKIGTGEMRLRGANTFTNLDVQAGFVRIDGTGGTATSMGTGTINTHGGAVPNTTSGTAIGTSISNTATQNIILNDDLGPDTMIVTNSPWTLNGNISGPGGLMLNGWTRTDTNAAIGSATQPLTLGGTNTFGGDVTINFGTIITTGGNAIPNGADVHISTTTTWGVTTTFNTAVLQLNANETIATIQGGTAVSAGDAADRGNVNLNGAAVQLTLGTADPFTYSGGMSGTGGFTKVGAGTMTMEDYNYTNSGPTNINVGTVQFANTNAGLSNSSVVTIASGATLNMGGFSDTIGGLAGAGAVTNGINLNLAGTAATTFSGTATLTGNFQKNAASTGITTITGGANSMATVTLNGGTLRASNTTGSATGNAAIAVNTGATLGGTGSVAGAVTVNTGGHIAPGASIESLAIGGGLTLNTGSILDFEVGAPGVSDLIDSTLSNGTNIAGSTTVNVTDTGGLGVGTYTLIDYAGTLGGSFGNMALGTTPGGFNYQLLNTGSVINLSVTAAVTNDADFNNDGTIDTADYVTWRKYNPLATGATQTTGDANGDGDNDSLDYDQWVATYGNPSPGGGAGGGGAVPEPTTIAMLMLGLVTFVAGRRSR